MRCVGVLHSLKRKMKSPVVISHFRDQAGAFRSSRLSFAFPCLAHESYMKLLNQRFEVMMNFGSL